MTKEEKLEAEKLNDNGVCILVGAVIRDALFDIKTKKMAFRNRKEKETITRNKQTAIHFFKTARLFKLTNLDYEWLYNNFDENVMSAYDINE